MYLKQTFSPEPHILLFRRALGTNPQTGRVDPQLIDTAKAEFIDQMGLRHNSVFEAGTNKSSMKNLK